MTFFQDGVEAGANPHVNYEPSSRQGLIQKENALGGPAYEPVLPLKEGENRVRRAPVERQNPFGQAGATWRNFEDWERDELVSNLVSALSGCNPDIQERMIGNLTKADKDYGARVAEGVKAAKK